MKLPRACGEPEIRGIIRQRPEDFFVDEVLRFEPDGAGEHLLVRVEKTGANTAWVATALARFAEVAPRDVSYAGRKDRHAVTRQWFSIWLPGRTDPQWADCAIEGVRVIESVRHGRKLRRGALESNRFVIVVRNLTGVAGLEERIDTLMRSGVPNYFGPQRFGHGGANLELARRLFSERLRLSRNKRSLALSAARSAIFNAVLAQRVSDGSWLRALRGEAINPAGRGGFFVSDDPDDEIARRIALGEVHLTGPMWGDGATLARHDVALLENKIAARHEVFVAGLAAARLAHERRALRVMPAAMDRELDGDRLCLSFGLPAGAYATGVLAELVDVIDAARPGA